MTVTITVVRKMAMKVPNSPVIAANEFLWSGLLR
jgi:hypothetical protein